MADYNKYLRIQEYLLPHLFVPMDTERIHDYLHDNHHYTGPELEPVPELEIALAPLYPTDFLSSIGRGMPSSGAGAIDIPSSVLTTLCLYMFGISRNLAGCC